MQFTLDGTTIITAIIGALWAVCIAAVGVWVKRVQLDTQLDRKQLAQLQKDLAAFREIVAREYASREEVRNERQEVRALLSQINAKIDDLMKTVIQR